MTEQKKPLIYLAGDIMSFGSNLARQYEYDKFKQAGIDADVYSPVMNKSINDKSNMTEDENNSLAEKITQQDIQRLWQSDCVVISPEQSAIGSLCELGCMYGWKYVQHVMDSMLNTILDNAEKDGIDITNKDGRTTDWLDHQLAFAFSLLLEHLVKKKVFAHYFDIRTNHLNEKDWRRSFSINQLLYGMILDLTEDHMLNNSFDEVLPKLKAALEQTDDKEVDDDASV